MAFIFAIAMLASSLVVLGLAPLVSTRGWSSAIPLAEAFLAALTTAYLALYLIGDDHYRADGTSRWEAYDAHWLAIAALAAGLTSCVLALIAGFGRRRILRPAGIVGAVSAILIGMALAAHTLN